MYHFIEIVKDERQLEKLNMQIDNDDLMEELKYLTSKLDRLVSKRLGNRLLTTPTGRSR